MPLDKLNDLATLGEQRTKINSTIDEINSVTDGTSFGDIPATATGTTTPRTLGDRAADVVNVKDFGAVGDGVTDDTAAIQASLNHAQNLGGNCTVDLNRGVYLKSDLSATLSLYGVDNVTITNGTILHDDKDTNPRRDLIAFNNCKNLVLSDLVIEGTLQTYQNETNQSQCLTGGNLTNFTMSNITIRNVRYMATAFNTCSGVTVTGCKLEDVLRDGLRFVKSTGVVINGNYLKNVADDCIAIHGITGDVNYSAQHVVSNNNIIGSQGIKVLGGKNVSISDNNLTLMNRGAIQVMTKVEPNTEGGTPMFNINVTGNIISDCFGSFGITEIIRVGVDTGRNYVAGSTPNITVPPYATNYDNELLSTDLNGGASGVRMSGNIIRRTRPSGGVYSSYGFGPLLDREASPVFQDPVITETDFNLHGISIIGPTKDFTIEGNLISGIGVGFRAIRDAPPYVGNGIQHINMRIAGNTISDCPGTGISLSGTGNTGGNQVVIDGNTFDLDPFFRHTTHNADNTWSTANSVLALLTVDSVGITMKGNTMKNLGSVFTFPFVGQYFDNDVHCDFAGIGDNTANKGVRFLPRDQIVNTITPINGDPTSATYGNIVNTVPKASAGVPTSGRYLRESFVRASAVNVNTGVSVTGWWRLTTGTGHVLGVDWLEIKADAS